MTPLTTDLLLYPKSMRKERKGETSKKIPFTIYFSQPELESEMLHCRLPEILLHLQVNYAKYTQENMPKTQGLILIFLVIDNSPPYLSTIK